MSFERRFRSFGQRSTRRRAVLSNTIVFERDHPLSADPGVDPSTLHERFLVTLVSDCCRRLDQGAADCQLTPQHITVIGGGGRGNASGAINERLCIPKGVGATMPKRSVASHVPPHRIVAAKRGAMQDRPGLRLQKRFAITMRP
jgi:hypothetical protein